MTLCREALRLEGKAYPKSCPMCKWGPCPKGFDYGSIKMKEQYAAIITRSYQEDDGYHSYNTVTYDTLQSFDTEEALKTFLIENQQKIYGSLKVKKIIKYAELKATTHVEISLG